MWWNLIWLWPVGAVLGLLYMSYKYGCNERIKNKYRNYNEIRPHYSERNDSDYDERNRRADDAYEKFWKADRANRDALEVDQIFQVTFWPVVAAFLIVMAPFVAVREIGERFGCGDA